MHGDSDRQGGMHACLRHEKHGTLDPRKEDRIFGIPWQQHNNFPVLHWKKNLAHTGVKTWIYAGIHNPKATMWILSLQEWERNLERTTACGKEFKTLGCMWKQIHSDLLDQCGCGLFNTELEMKHAKIIPGVGLSIQKLWRLIPARHKWVGGWRS